VATEKRHAQVYLFGGAVDQHPDAGDIAAGFFHRLHDLAHRAPRRKNVVDYKYPLAGFDAEAATERPAPGIVFLGEDAAHAELDARSPESLVKLNKRAFNVLGCGFRFLQMLSSIGLLAVVPGWVGRLWFNPIPEEILLSVVLDDPSTPMEFLNGFKARYPGLCSQLWATALNNGYILDTSSPPAPTNVYSTTHPIGVPEGDPTAQCLDDEVIGETGQHHG